MPGHTWPGTAMELLGMWLVSMVLMMLPSAVPALWRYRQPLGNTTRVGLGYVFVWTIAGLVTYPLSAVAGQVTPVTSGVVVLAAGVLQFTTWKAHHLACCRRGPWHGRSASAVGGSPWLDGLRLGFHCVCSCAGPMSILLVMGMMDHRIMAGVAGAITLERVLPASQHVERALGIASVGLGCLLILDP